ncbi:MAG: ABC transporter permease subunit [Dehalococcoidales bacterium]|nr:ABC transporter permease subunit [Dehalococcoidales bacterium]
MSRKRILNILIKEWRVLFTDVSSMMIVTFLPFLIIGQMLLYVWLAVNFAGDKAMDIGVFQNALAKLQVAIPRVADLSGAEPFLVLLLNQFTIFLLLIPVMIAMNTVTFSIVDEKLSGSLEALLATPVRTWELLLGKALAGAIPSLLMTWLVAGVFLLVLSLMGWGNLVGMVLTPVWFLSLFLLTPAITALSFLLGIIGSSRAKDAKSAQNIVLVVILPLFGLIALQVTGIAWLNALSMLGLAVLLIIIDFIVLRIAVRLFQRESIVVKWRQ